jgi:cytochrome c oxidase subunit 3
MANTHAIDTDKYYVPHQSPWPIVGSFALFTLMLGAISFMNEWAGGWVFLPGAALVLFMFFGWSAPSSARTRRACTASASTSRSAWE